MAGRYDSWCKECQIESAKAWVDKNRARKNAYNLKRMHARGDRRPMKEAKDCASYLGVHVAERVLSSVFENVRRMPNNYPGYDFICGKGYKIDVKSSCLYHKGDWNWWAFTIKYNKDADYFLCIAFDNRMDLNPQHIWLIPGRLINHKKALGISNRSLAKWINYEKPIGEVIHCCESLKNSPPTLPTENR